MMSDRVASRTYNSIPHGRAPESEQWVLFTKKSEVTEIDSLTKLQPRRTNVIEIRSITDLLRELRHFGDKKEHTDGHQYYRFGDWVVKMNLKTFYVHVEGIILSDEEYLFHTYEYYAKRNLIQQLCVLQGLPPEYNRMQPKIDENLFHDVQNWIKMVSK